MLSENLYDFIFASENLPPVLKTDGLRERLIDQLNNYIKTNTYKNKLLLQQAGMVSDRIYFVEQGIVRGYTSDSETGREKTIALWPSLSVIVDPNSFIHQIESEVYIEVLPNTELSSITRVNLQKIFSAFPFTKVFLTYLIKNDIKYSNKRLLDKSITAWERLAEMRRTYPGLEQMVSKETIASFLNISPQHLSKIIRDHFRTGSKRK